MMTNNQMPNKLLTAEGQTDYLEALISDTDGAFEKNQDDVLRDFFDQAPVDAEKFIINCSDHESPIVRKLASLAVENILEFNPETAVSIIKKSLNDKAEEVAATARVYYLARIQEDGEDLLKKIGLIGIAQIIQDVPYRNNITAREAESDARDIRADNRQVVADIRESLANDRQDIADNREEMHINATAKDAKSRIGYAQARIGDAQAELDAADVHMETLRDEVSSVLKLERETADLRRIADEQMATAAAALAEAKDSSAEYERAVYHYTSLIRHRIANPLQTICGMSQTLLEMPDLPLEKRIKMIEDIHEQSLILAYVSLDPYTNDVTERNLRPLPSTDTKS